MFAHPSQQLLYGVHTEEEQQHLFNHQYWMHQQQLFHSLMNPMGFPVVVFYPGFESQVPRTNPLKGRRRPLREFWTKEVLNSERRVQAKKQTKLAIRLGRKLKRLQRRSSQRVGRGQHGERESTEQGKEQWKRYRRQKTGKIVPDSEEPRKCGLWSCDGSRPRFRRSLRRSRSLRSVLSNLSVRSRTPIHFRRSPILNLEGFPTSES